MSRFRKVEAATWGDLRFRDLSEDAKLLWFYLLTGPAVTTLPGVLVIGRASLAEAMKWSVRRLDKAFVEFAKTDREHPMAMAVADWKSRLVWLPNAPKHNKPTNRFVIRSWGGHWSSVPECPLRGQIEARLRSFVRGWGEEYMAEFAVFAPEIAPPAVPSLEGSNPPVIPPPLTLPSNPPVLSSTAPALSTAPADTTRARAESRAIEAGAATMPDWFVVAIDVVESTTGEKLDRPVAWLRYSGSRRTSGKPTGTADAQQWLAGVDVREARERRQRESDRRERQGLPAPIVAESVARTKWPDEPPPPPEPNYTPEELAAIDARLALSLVVGTADHRASIADDHEFPGDPRLRNRREIA